MSEEKTTDREVIPVNFFCTTVVVYGPAGCGKTSNAIRLRAKYGCRQIVDDWCADLPLTEGALHLTSTLPKLMPGAYFVDYATAIGWQ